MPIEDFESLKARAKATEAIETVLTNHERVMERDSDNFLAVVKDLEIEQKKSEKLQKENLTLKQQNGELQKENKTLKSQLNVLMEFAKAHWSRFKEWQVERQQEKEKTIARKRDQELER